MPTGTIKRLVRDRGFGFIRDEGGQEWFFHRSAVGEGGFEKLAEGQRVRFDEEPSPVTLPALRMRTLLLFDIDGTLIRTGGAGTRSMTRAFELVFQIPSAFTGIPMAGRTDPRILADALARSGIGASAETIQRFRECYRVCLIEELGRSSTKGSRVLPGVRDLLDALDARPDVFLALLTGNYSEAARVKLEHFSLWERFRCGAFGEDGLERSDLVGVAAARARSAGWLGAVPGDVVVVGDTPLDVACALAAGARPIAVATGGHDAEALRAAGAEVAFEDLSDTGAFLRLVEKEAAARSRAGE